MRYENRSWGKTVRALWIIGAAALLISLLVFLISGYTGLLGSVIDAEILALLFFPFLKIMGMPWAQPYVELRSDGIAYGTKQFVPWDHVEGIEFVVHPLGRKRSLMVRTRGWKASGPFKLFIRGSMLPLSALGPAEGPEYWMDSVKAVAPNIPLPTV